MAKKGRPSEFNEKRVKAIEIMARRGFTDAEMATALCIDESTLNNWKKDHPDFFESLKDWKSLADEKVERSLYERATGYSCPESKPQWVESTRVEDGVAVKDGRWEYSDHKKHYPPDVTAQIFWLKNRQPERWRDQRHLTIDNDLEGMSDEDLDAAESEIEGGNG